MKIPVIVIAGPTASGKSALALELAEKYNGEIVSADSMQIYKGLDIGTAKPNADELKRVRHHLIDIAERNEAFSAADFCEKAREAVSDIHSRGRLPIMVGGTGLYIDSFLYGVSFSHSNENTNLRDELSALAREKGNDAVHKILSELDGEAAKKIHPNNLKRVIRAIEIIKESGKSLEESIEKPKTESEYNFIYVVLMPNRSVLYERINMRVDEMVKQGLLNEAKMLYDEHLPSDATCMQAIGYKELFPIFEKGADEKDALETLKKDSRHYAKRQITWFKRHDEALVLEKPCLEELENSNKFSEFIKNGGEAEL